jgi:Spy/CpxP family protein refolding chaperone
MKKRLWILGLILLVVINLSALMTFAYQRWLKGPGDHPRAVGTPTDAATKQMCLSGEQKTCLRTLRFSFDSEVEEIQARLQERKKAMVEEMKKESPDGSLIEKLIEETSRLQAEIQKKAVVYLLKEKDVLTPEQRAIFFRTMENHVCPLKKEAGRPSAGGGGAKCPQARLQ